MSWGIWMRQGQEWHVCLSASRCVARETVGSHVQKRKKNSWAKVCQFDWLGITQTEDNERKLFAVQPWGKWDHIWTPQPYGASQYMLCNCSAPALFFNLSNYLACLSFWFCTFTLLCLVPHYQPSHCSFKRNTWHHLKSAAMQPKTPLIKADICSY